MGKSQYVSKHVRETAVHGYPEPIGDQFVVKLIRSRGGNVMECENAEGTTLLCILPAKFSKVGFVYLTPHDFRYKLPRDCRLFGLKEVIS